jgi:glucan phosphoethanolaminetransferase (alkaline phosphatase superfamily)
MARSLDSDARDGEAQGVVVAPALKQELRRLANLFLLSSITLALFLLRAFHEALSVSFVPRSVIVVWGVVMLTGWAMTYVFGLYVIVKARRLGWTVLFAIPFTCVPAGVAYAWTRRMEIEREVLGIEPHAASRQKRGGRRR